MQQAGQARDQGQREAGRAKAAMPAAGAIGPAMLSVQAGLCAPWTTCRHGFYLVSKCTGAARIAAGRGCQAIGPGRSLARPARCCRAANGMHAL